MEWAAGSRKCLLAWMALREVYKASHVLFLPFSSVSSYILIVKSTIFTSSKTYDLIMKLLSFTFTILTLAATSAVAAPAPTCEGRYYTVYPEPWSGVRKNVSVDCKTNSVSSFIWCVGGCENGACL